jgi:hypothetical protein
MVHKHTNHGRTGRKKLGGGGNKFDRLFQIVPELWKKIFWRNFPKLLSTGGTSDYEKFLLDSIFPTKLTEFPTKFVPFIFIISQYCLTVKRILTCPTVFVCPTNWGGGCRPPLPRPVRPWHQRLQFSKSTVLGALCELTHYCYL